MNKLDNLGLSIIYNFITLDEEKILLQKIEKKSIYKDKKSRNSIQRFGSSLPFLKTYLNLPKQKLMFDSHFQDDHLLIS